MTYNKLWLKVSVVALALVMSLGAAPLSTLAASGHGESGDFRFRVDVDRDFDRDFEGRVFLTPLEIPELGLRKRIELRNGGFEKKIEIENGVVTRLEVKRDFDDDAVRLPLDSVRVSKLLELLRTHLKM